MRRLIALPLLLLYGVAGCSAPAPAPQAAPSRTATVTATARAGPQWFAVLQKGQLHWHDSRTGADVGTGGGPERTTLTAIAPWHDDHSIVLAGRRRDAPGCESVVQRQVIRSADRLDETDVGGLDDIPGVVEGMAVSPDHTRLALALRITLTHAKPCGTGDQQAQLWVVDLASKARRVWTLTVDKASRPEDETHQFVNVWTWAADGRHLVVDVGACCDGAGPGAVLDTAARPGPLEPLLHEIPTPSGGCLGPPYLWTAHGLLYSDCNAQALQFLDPVTGTVTSTLVHNDENAATLSVDSTGEHYLAYLGQAVFRIDAGKARRLMALPWDPESPPSALW